LKKITIALVGQPNVGKSTLFNIIARGNAIVSNWPGTTVEINKSTVVHNEYELEFFDLPGIYGLMGVTLEERVARSFLLEARPDVAVVLADSLNLERTLILALEVLEITGKVVIAVTKTDVAHSKGVHINYELLEKRLGAPVVPVSAIKKIGLDRLFEAILRISNEDRRPLTISYGELEPFILSVEQMIREAQNPPSYPTRWIAIKYLESDPEVEELLSRSLAERYKELEEIRRECRRRIGEDIAVFVSKKKISYIQESIVKGAVVRAVVKEKRKTSSVLYNPVAAATLSVLFIFALFIGVFIVNTGYPLTAILERVGQSELASKIEEYTLSGLVEKLFEYISSIVYDRLGETTLALFITEGLLGGVAAVLVFLPLIVIVMAVLGALEDSGILPRLAIGTHTILQKIGLSGHAILPVTLSLGCNVPGVLSTRAVPSAGEKLRLIMLTPFIPCQARLVVLLALATGIGGITGSVLVPLVYLVSFAVFATLSYASYKLASKKRREEVELLLEIPPLHRPYARVVWWFTWQNVKHFLAKAGTIIFAVSIISWGLQHVSTTLTFTSDIDNSIVASGSQKLSFLLKPLGISGESSWIVAYALIIGFLAKELVIAALMTATGALFIQEAVSSLGLTAPSLIALALFIALYVPCLATLATIYMESKNARYAVITIILMIAMAYVLGALAYLLANVFL
jgi:ferrous iron transport protein B